MTQNALEERKWKEKTVQEREAEQSVLSLVNEPDLMRYLKESLMFGLHLGSISPCFVYSSVLLFFVGRTLAEYFNLLEVCNWTSMS